MFSSRSIRVVAITLFAALAATAMACGSDRPSTVPTTTPTIGPLTPTAVPATPTPTPAVTPPTPGIPTPTPTTEPEVTPTPTHSELQILLDAARARWSANRPESYRFDLTWRCFCAYSGMATRLSVEGGSVVTAVDPVSGEVISEEDRGQQMTVDELLDWIQRGLDTDDAKVLQAEFERDLGYPISASVDWLVGATDTGLSFTVNNFKLGKAYIDLEQLRMDLDSALFRWFEHGPQNYTFTFQRACFCPPEFTMPVIIEVRSGQVTQVTSVETGLPVTGEHMTVRDLFGWISERLNRNPDFADLEFDAETGYPLKARFDPILNLYDDEEAFFIEDLAPIDVHTELRAELDAARARWAERSSTHYTFRFNWSCFCVREFVAPVIVTVRDGDVTDVTRVEDGQPVSEQFSDSFVTVDGLFDRLEEAVEQGAASIRAEFDPDTGLPSEVFIDRNFMIADEEIGWNAGELATIQ